MNKYFVGSGSDRPVRGTRGRPKTSAFKSRSGLELVVTVGRSA